MLMHKPILRDLSRLVELLEGYVESSSTTVGSSKADLALAELKRVTEALHALDQRWQKKPSANLPECSEFHDIGNGIMNIAWYIRECELANVPEIRNALARRWWKDLAAQANELRRTASLIGASRKDMIG